MKLRNRLDRLEQTRSGPECNAIDLTGIDAETREALGEGYEATLACEAADATEVFYSAVLARLSPTQADMLQSRLRSKAFSAMIERERAGA